MLVVYSSPVTDIAVEQGTDADDDLDPLNRAILAEERAESEFRMSDSTLNRTEFVRAYRFNYL